MTALASISAPWTPAERAILRPPPRLSVSEWADAYRILGPGQSAEAGAWRTSRTPYLREIIDALGDPRYTEIVVCKPAQVGASEGIRCAIAYWCDYDPGPCLIVFPSEDAAKRNMKKRVGPMFLDSPKLHPYLPGNRDDVTLCEVTLSSMRLRAGWAGSPQALATDPERYVILEEEDKYPAYSGNEAAPSALAAARTRTFGHRAKVVHNSTPTTDKGPIWKAFESCADRRRYHVPCPRCGEFQILTKDRFRWEGYPNDPEPEMLEERGVWYECEHCHGRVEEHEKDAMSARGEWRCEPDENGVVPEKGSSHRVGFQFSAFVATIGVRWRLLMAKWFRVKHDPAALMEFVTQELGEPWRDQVDRVNDSRVKARSTAGNKRGVVPEWASCVIVTADTQKDKFYWLARAWGARERSQLVDLGVTKGGDGGFAEMNALLKKAYPVGSSALTLCPVMIGVDVGGGTKTDSDGNRTDEVYRWAARNPSQILCLKGWGGNGTPQRIVSIGTHKYERKGYSGFQVRLCVIDTQTLKDVLSQRVNHEPAEGDPDLWTLCNDLPPEYFEHMAAEQKVTMRRAGRMIGTWVARSHGRRRDLLDCEVYQLAMAKVIGADQFPDESVARKTREEQAKPPRPDSDDDDRGSKWARGGSEGSGWWSGARRDRR